MSPSVRHPLEVLFDGGVVLACAPDGQVEAHELQGLFAGDTRVLSTHRLAINGRPWQLLGRARPDTRSGVWDYQNARFATPSGEVAPQTLHLRLERRVDRALHERLIVRSFADRRVRATLSLQVDADFADLFEVKEQRLPPRPSVSRSGDARRIRIAYKRGGFERGLDVDVRSDGALHLVGTRLLFDLDLGHGEAWTCELTLEPNGTGIAHMAHAIEPRAHDVVLEAPALLREPLERGAADLRSLQMRDAEGDVFLAGGAPWFLTLFGRDSLLAGIMGALAGTGPIVGALGAVGRTQAAERDDWRDAEPGKLLHEIRVGELARSGAIPHTPYYGAHDVPALYVLALWSAWRWTGEAGLLETHRPTAERALRWCDELGDRDGDGLQEYGTRSRRGYLNQGWKDAGDAIVTEDGSQADPPIATVEVQGNLYAARLAMAEILEASSRPEDAERERRAAEDLRRIVEERFWLEDLGSYAMALDRDKRPLRSIGSNAAQLLWSGLPGPDRARLVAERTLEADMFSGWGIRTLSAAHPAYDPLSYQRGSVWPHDSMLAAAGMARYGLDSQAHTVLGALLDVAMEFEDRRLPELFCGFERSDGLVPYIEANVPQAWAAAVPVLAAQLLLGLVPDAPRGRCFVAPSLPERLPALRVRGVRVGGHELDLTIARRGTETLIDDADADGLELVEGPVEAPLWGRIGPDV
jgi:glycogen debranching enzyme